MGKGAKKVRSSGQLASTLATTASSAIYFYTPSLLLCTITVVEIGLCMQMHWFAVAANAVHEDVKKWMFLGSMVLVAILSIWSRARSAAADHLDALPRTGRAIHAAWLGAAFAGIFSLFFFLKYCQYRSFQLPSDSTVTANLCWNIAHKFSFASSVLGVENYFAVHFMPLLAILAPVLLAWNSLSSLIFLNALALASMPLAAYVLVYRKTGSSLAAAAALWIIFTSPFLLYLSTASVVANIYTSVFFVWAIVAAELGNWRWASLGFVLMAMTIEQSCFAFLGLGLYLIGHLGIREKRAWLTGGAVCLVSVALFVLEMKLRWSLPDATRFPTTSWSLFTNLGATPTAALSSFSAHPLQIAKTVAWPPARLQPLWVMFSSTGFLPLLQPAVLIPWAVNYIPNFLAVAGPYHSLESHYSSYVIGPLWWAAMMGMIWAHSWLSRRGLAAWILIYALLVGMLNLRQSPRILAAGWNGSFYDEVPALAAKIPAEASVWSYEFAAPSLGCRPFIKILAGGDLNDIFTSHLFMPDYVLIWREADIEAGYQARLWTFLAREGYTKVSETFDLILLKHPRAPLEKAGGDPPGLELPIPGKNAPAYGKYLESFTDPTEMIRLWRLAADAGDAFSQVMLGSAYFQGLGVPKDSQESIKWFRRAADQGYARAQYNLGFAYLSGLGVPKDATEAVKWLRLAADQGYGPAELSLAGILAAQGKVDKVSK
jgi:uncharacterized membrane protein